MLEHAADGFHSSGATSAAATDEDDDRYDDAPQSDDDDDDDDADRRSGGDDVSVEPSASCSVTSEDEPLLDCADYRKIRDLNRRAYRAAIITCNMRCVCGLRARGCARTSRMRSLKRPLRPTYSQAVG